MTNYGLGTWIHRRRVRSAGDTAIISKKGVTSYKQLAVRIDRLANALRDRGVARGDRVAYLGENSQEFLETLFAVNTLGAVFVPINTRLASPEVRFVLDDSGATMLIVSSSLESLAIAGLRGTHVRHLVKVEEGLRSSTHEVDEDVNDEEFEALIASGEPHHPEVQVDHADLAIILYTSGTTGNPKGAMLTHGNLIWNAFNVLTVFDITSHEIALMIAPMFHVASLGMGALPTLLKGGTVVLESDFQPGRALELVEKHRVTYICGVPITYQLLAEHPDWDTTDISSLRNLTCGGSAVPLNILEAYEQRGLSFTMGYGLTEAAPGVTTLPVAYTRQKHGSGGLPLFHSAVRVVDPMNRVLPNGEIGEIQVQGPNVISSYWNRPDALSTAFVEAEDGTWHRTGDLGYLDDEGFLFVSDRLKDMIISGGENIYPAEIERLLEQLESIAAVAVFGVEDDKWGEVPRAAIVIRSGHELTEGQVLSFLDGKLARYKIPKSIVFVEDMPRTASGKIRKPDLRKVYGSATTKQ